MDDKQLPTNQPGNAGYSGGPQPYGGRPAPGQDVQVYPVTGSAPQIPQSTPVGQHRPAYSFNKPPDATDNTETIESPKVREGIKSIISTFLILILAPILAVLITSFLFQSYEVDGPSMEQTLHHGDRLVVLKASKTWSKLTGKNYIPERGAIIVFEKPDSVDEKQLIKRVIALPGEHVVVADGKVTVTNKEHPEGYDPDKGTSYSNTVTNTVGEVDLTVPEGEVFVMGDNRGNSLDSRYFGPVKSKEIAGRLLLRVFPFNKAQVY